MTNFIEAGVRDAVEKGYIQVEDESMRTQKSDVEPPPDIVDEPGMAERFQRGLQRALNTPPKHQHAPRPKPKKTASEGRARKGKTQN